MGIAYRCWDTNEGVPVVVKMPQERFRENEEFTKRFAREIRTSTALVHPHIVPILDDAVELGCPYVVMRFLPGGSLADRLLRDKQGALSPVSPSFLHLWLPAIAAALDFAHAKGVVHRDVKPDNIFFDSHWSAFLGDFGIAKVFQESDVVSKDETLTATHAAIGTQGYMAPEMFTNKSGVDGRADQYALGIMVYEQLCGMRPFSGAKAHVAIEHCTMEPPPLRGQRADLPRSLCEAVHRALRKLPEERFATCRDFAAAVLQNIPVLADEPGVARLLCPGCRRILKLRDSARGKEGACPRCKQAIRVAPDLGSLWLTSEEQLPQKAVIRRASPTFTGEISSTQDRLPQRRVFAAIGCVAVAVACAFLLAAVVRRNDGPPSNVGLPEPPTKDVVSRPQVEAAGLRSPEPSVSSVGFPSARTVISVPVTMLSDSQHASGHVIQDLLESDFARGRPVSIPAMLSSGVRPWEMRNRGAFAALKRNGEVVTWGAADAGGDSMPVRHFLASGVTRIFSNARAFAALKEDGSVVAWGDARSGGGLDSDQPVVRAGVTRVLSTCAAFAAIKTDGAVEAWGTQKWWDGRKLSRRHPLPGEAPRLERRPGRPVFGYDYEPDGTSAGQRMDSDFFVGGANERVQSDQFSSRVFADRYMFPADSMNMAGGAAGEPRGSQSVHPLLRTRLFATHGALASLSLNGQVETWGRRDAGGESRQFAGLLAADVVDVCATHSAFAVLRSNGSVLAFGSDAEGGNPSSVAARLQDGVVLIRSTVAAFAALKADGSVVTWGDARRGGDSSRLPSTVTEAGQLTQGIRVIVASSEAFAGITGEGAVVAWGNPNAGGDVSAVQSMVDHGAIAIAATGRAFAALKEDGSVVSWGDSAAGGDATGVAEKLRSGVVFIASTDAAFAALKSDGSVVAWGAPEAGGELGPARAAVAEDVVSLASPFMDEPDASVAACDLRIIQNHAQNKHGVWQYSRDGKTWANMSTDLDMVSSFVLESSDRLRYLPQAPHAPAGQHLNAVVINRDNGPDTRPGGAVRQGTLQPTPYSFGFLALVPQDDERSRGEQRQDEPKESVSDE